MMILAVVLSFQVVRASSTSGNLFVSSRGTGADCARNRPCSLSTAQRKVRELAPGMTGDLTITLDAGRYLMRHPLRLEVADSGLNGHVIHWKGVVSGKTVFDGSIHIRNWSRVAGHRNLWQAAVPRGEDSLQLFINGKRAVRARIAGCKKSECRYSEAGLIGGASGLPSLKHPEEVVAVFDVRWRDFHCPLRSIDGKNIVMAQPCWHNTVIDSKKNGWSNASPIGKPFAGIGWFENAFEFLGTPGQFYLDRRRNILYYTPRDGEDMKTADAEMPIAEHLLTVEGTPEHRVHDVSIEGLAFAHTTWIYGDDDGYVPLQAGYLITGSRDKLPDNGEGMWRIPAAVEVSGGERISFLSDQFVGLGAAGISFAGGTRDSVISHSDFRDISGGAIFVGDTVAWPSSPEDRSRDNTVSWNTISYIAQEYRDNIAIMGGFNDGLLIAHNTISNIPYTGISAGWGWDYEGEQDVQRDIHIQSNHITNFMLQLNDGGAIYTQAQSPHSSVTENYIDYSGTDHGNGIYLDERSRGFDVCGNVVWNMRQAPEITEGQWVSAWSSWSGNLDIHDNWSNDTHTRLHNPGKTKLFHDNHLALKELPSEAAQVIAASGASARTQALVTACRNQSTTHQEN